MKRTIILECNGHKDNYVEWDFVLMRPASKEAYEKRQIDRDWQRDPNSYYYSDLPQQPMVDMWEQMYWDKYILGRIQRVTETHRWKLRATVDFAYLTTEWTWRTWKPFGWRYNYFDALHVDMIKCIDYIKDWHWSLFLSTTNKLMKQKQICWIPVSKIVMHRGSAGRRADMSTQVQENICSNAERRWRDRHLTSTPNE